MAILFIIVGNLSSCSWDVDCNNVIKTCCCIIPFDWWHVSFSYLNLFDASKLWYPSRKFCHQ